MERYPVGARMSGKVVSLTDYGAFVELGGRRRPDPRQRDVVEQARQTPVEDPQRREIRWTRLVLGVDPTARRIRFGLKQVETNPWHDLAGKYPVGSKIQGKVRNLTEFGASRRGGREIDGLIHISDAVEQADRYPSRS